MVGVPSSSDLDALLEGVRRGAPDAFADLYSMLADDLNSFAYSMLRDPKAAEDAVQQAFLELVKGASTIRGDGKSLRAWLYKSVRFRCLDELRRRRRKPETLVGNFPDADHPATEDPTFEVDPELEAALAELTPDQRAVLYLRHIAGLSGQETAKAMRSTRAAVFATAARAERRLRNLLGGEQ